MSRRVAAASAAALAPFVVLIARAAHGTWIATGDYSLIELQTRAVGGSDTPLVGPYSRFGWNHPGPSLFFALNLPFRVLSSRGAGLLAGAAVIGAVATVTIVVVLLRAPTTRTVMAFGLLVTAIFLRALGGKYLWDPWNPRVIVLPFLALVLLSLWAATGEARAFPVAVAFASFVTQTHVSLVPEAVALLALALGFLIGAARREPARRAGLRRTLFVSLGVFAVLWSPPVIQQLQPSGGNLGDLWRFWTTAHPNTIGFARATRLLAPQLSIPAPWMTGHERAAASNGALVTPRFAFPFALVLLALAVVVAGRRRDRIGLIACAFAATSTLVAWLSVARVIGIPYPYVLGWDWVVGAVCWIASATALLPPLVDRLRPRAHFWLERGLAAGAFAIVAIVAVTSISAVTPLASASHAADALTADTAPRLRGMPRPILVQTNFRAVFLAEGLVSALLERGITTRYPDPLLRAAGERPKHRVGTSVFVAVGVDVATYARDPAYRRIASTTWHRSPHVPGQPDDVPVAAFVYAVPQ